MIPHVAAARRAGRLVSTVLIVEDNADVGEFARQLLDDLGFETCLVANAQRAIAILEERAQDFDFVFSDVIMPGMGGLELGRHIRNRWPNLSVVLTSGYSQVLADDAHHGFPVLHKPYSVGELGRTLRAARDQRTSRPSRVRAEALPFQAMQQCRARDLIPAE